MSVQVIFQLPGSECLCGAEPTPAEYVGGWFDELSSDISLNSMPGFYSVLPSTFNHDLLRKDC